MNITSQERFIEVLGQCISSSLSDDSYYKICVGDISYCEAQNNLATQWNLSTSSSVYSNNSKIDRSVVKCGVRFSGWYTYSWHTCWGKSYGTVYYNSESAPTHAGSEDCPIIVEQSLSSINFVRWLMQWRLQGGFRGFWKLVSLPIRPDMSLAMLSEAGMITATRKGKQNGTSC